MSFSELAAKLNICCGDFAVIFAIFTKVCRVFCHFLSTVPNHRGLAEIRSTKADDRCEMALRCSFAILSRAV